MRVRLTTDARTDLDDIFSFIATDSPSAAEAVLTRLRDACLQLADTPKRYPVAFARDRSEIRRRPAGSYNIYFRVQDGGVEIVRIVHSARDATRLFPQT
jgi:toxin ParE1/3/4